MAPRLDLDDMGAVVGQLFGHDRPGGSPGEVCHLDPGKDLLGHVGILHAALALASAGQISASCSPGFGAGVSRRSGVLLRFAHTAGYSRRVLRAGSDSWS